MTFIEISKVLDDIIYDISKSRDTCFLSRRGVLIGVDIEIFKGDWHHWEYHAAMIF